MPNTLLTPQIIANEALAILVNNLVYADLVHRDYSPEFQQIGDTITVRNPATLVAKDFAGQIENQDITEGSVTVKLDRHKDVSVKITSKQATLELKDFSKQVIAPAMIALSQKVDEDIANYIFGVAKNTVTAEKLAPTNLADIANMAKALDKKKAPIQDRHLVLSPDHKYRYALTDNLSKVNYAGTNETLREALLGRVYAFDTYMDQNNPASSATTSGTAVGTIKVTSSSDAGEIDITDGSAATATLIKGDGFVYKGILYRFDENVTLVSSEKTSIKTVPAFPAAVTAVAVSIVRNSASVGFHRNAVAFVNRNLEIPMGAARAAIANAQDFGVRVVYGYDQDTKTDVISFDILYGISELNGDLATRLVDGTLS